MADVRLPSSPLPAAPARPPSPARVEALRNAQRAFFEAALAGAAAPAPQAASPARTPVADAGATLAPDRPLRPGSLVDIKV